MRCLNCGWDNSDGASVCLKCGQPLFSTPGPNLQGGQREILNPLLANRLSGNDGGKKTVILRRDSAEQHATRIQKPIACPHCGYPVVTGVESCPNCGASLLHQHASDPSPKGKEQPINEADITCENCGSVIKAHFSFCPVCGGKIRRKTVHMPIKAVAEMIKQLSPTCSLTLIPEDGEKVDAVAHDFQGASVILNRDNTEENNYTITSKQQAELIFENGNWYIEDRSELHTTYIQVTHRYPLSPGDVVVLGDRKFRFDSKEE